MRLNVKNKVIKLLLNSGYVSYAKVLSNLEVYFDAEVETAYIQGGKIVVIGSLFLDKGDDFISLATRHELSHLILDHSRRGVKHNVENFDLWNIACDAELSNYYTSHDREKVLSKPFMSGAVDIELHPSFVMYKGWKAEDVYDDLLKTCNKNKKDSRFGDVQNAGSAVEGATIEDLLKDIDQIERSISKTKQYQVEISHVDTIVYSKENQILFDIETEYRHILKPRKKRTFTRENLVYADQDIIKAAKAKVKVKSPTLHCFVDRSGSMTYEKTKHAEKIVENLAKNKLLTIITHTFSNDIDNTIGQGTNYDGIVQYSKARGLEDIIIITDDDSDNIVTQYTFNKVFIIPVLNTKPNLKINSKTLKNY